MKKTIKFIGIIALVAVIVFSMISCGSTAEPEAPEPVPYVEQRPEPPPEKPEEVRIDEPVVHTPETVVLTHVISIQFLANSVNIRDSEINRFLEVTSVLRNVHGRKIVVSGHAASAGDKEDEMRISIERANAVASLIVSMGVAASNEITVIGRGSDDPVGDNSTLQGMAANRRVEISY